MRTRTRNWVALAFVLLIGVGVYASGHAGIDYKPTNDVTVDGIWGGNHLVLDPNYTFLGLPVVTYSFYKVNGPRQDAVEYLDKHEMSDASKNYFRAALGARAYMYSVGLYFIEVQESDGLVGQIRIGISDSISVGAECQGRGPFLDGNQNGSGQDAPLISSASDVFCRSAYDNNSFPNGLAYGPNSHGFAVILHELGHAMGLRHPPSADDVLPGHFTDEWTLMKQNMTGHKAGDPVNYYENYRPDDKYTLQWLYGCPLFGCGGYDPFGS